MKTSQQITQASNRIDGLQAQLDYITNDMLNALQPSYDPQEPFFILYAQHCHRSISQAEPVLENLRSDLDEIKQLLETTYKSVLIQEKTNKAV